MVDINILNLIFQQGKKKKKKGMKRYGGAQAATFLHFHLDQG